MIKFIDVDNHLTYSGEEPYIFYISDACSTGKWYSRTIVFLSDAASVHVSLPEDSKFHIVRPPRRQNDYTKVYGHTYGDLKRLMTQECTNRGQSMNVRINNDAGTTQVYAHEIHIAFMGDTEGEVRDTLTIDDGSETTPTFTVGADVYQDDERLADDLSVMGFEMPNQFQRAMYTTNVRDESTDQLLVNRKWKELLIDYWQILANKGNYNSLINSIKFFEYGDLLKIYEYWKQTDQFNQESIISRDIEQVLDPLFHKYLDVMSKTTYISLQMALNDLNVTDDGVVYQQQPLAEQYLDGSNKFLPEPIPEIQDIALMWSVDDLMMKMTLLANFFSTYFMPIHLDLLQSTVEKIVMTNCIKIMKSARRRREDFYESLKPLSCNLSNEKDYWLGNVSAYNYPDTVLRDSGVPVYWGDRQWVGIDPEKQYDTVFTLDDVKRYLNQYFSGVGVIVPVHVKFEMMDQFFKTARIVIYKQRTGDQYDLTCNYLSEIPIVRGSVPNGPENELKFNLLFEHTGKYCIMLQLTDSSGAEYSDSWYINVYGNAANEIEFKKLRKIEYNRPGDDMADCEDWFYDNHTINDFMFTQGTDEQIHYKQWLLPSDFAQPDGAGLNHTLIIDMGADTIASPLRDIHLISGIKDCTYTLDTEHPEYLETTLSTDFKHYWWKVLKDRPIAKRKGKYVELNTDDLHWFLIGVRKYMDSDKELTRDIYSKIHHIYNDDDDEGYPVKVVYTSYTPPSLDIDDIARYTGRGYLTVTAPVGTRIRMNNSVWNSTHIETTTIPLKATDTTVDLEYRYGGHLFKKTLKVSDMFTVYGTDGYKISCDKQRGYVTVSESRFYPALHRVVPMTEQHISNSDIVVCVPALRHVTREPDSAYWEFVNRSTGDVTVSKDLDVNRELYVQQPYVGRYDYARRLPKGYYDVILHYTLDGVDNTESVESAFEIL